MKYPKLGSNTDKKKVINQLNIVELREQFEDQQHRVYGLSKSWFVRFDTGNYKDRDTEQGWMAYQLCARANNLVTIKGE